MQDKETHQRKVMELFVDHNDRLQGYLRARLSNPEDAAELAQEAYLRMLRVRRADLIKNPQAYLFRIARNLLHELYTSTDLDSLVDTDGDPDALESHEPSPEDCAVLAARQAMMQKAVAELPTKCQAALALHWRYGLTQKEIAERINLSRQMVQKYLARGIAHCQKRLRHVAAQERGSR